ncbi:MAG: hypothetical protein JO267_11900 [Alphaproteobacteria bacterium]|nr:hypothetical protein [Alphaproteobacteria bacterium]
MPRCRLVLAQTAALLALAGCGWTPLYADRETGPADQALRTIRVDPIPERVGQRLEMALRDSLDGGEPGPKRYVLHTLLSVNLVDLGIQSQGLGTRGKLDVYATITLAEINKAGTLLTNVVHAAESFDIQANGYSTVVAEEDARNRAVEELRREIVARLTLFMQRRAAQTAAAPAP